MALAPAHSLRLLSCLALLGGCGPELVASDDEGTEWEEGPTRLPTGGGADGETPPAYEALPAGASLEQPFAALFAPDDPVITTEVAMIERVTAAREADPAASLLEGDNPYRIRYAVYNLRNPLVIAALARAHDAGVDVQVLVEADQLDPARTWNTADEELVARGWELVTDIRTLTDATRRSADLVGVTGSGLMHLKTRLFETPSWQSVLTGSMNPGDEAVANEETLHLVNEPRLVARYRTAYEAVLARRTSIPNEWTASAPVNVLFTPAASGPRAGTEVLRWVAAENEQILLMVFSLRDVAAPGASETLVELLIRKAREGVPVYVITDRKQSDGIDGSGLRIATDDRTEDRLRAGGVHVYEAMNLATPFTAMHHKVAILGRTHLRVITDAANWTAAGLGTRTRDSRNVESVLFIDSDALDGGRTGRRYLAQWLRVLSRYAAQSAPDGEPAFEVVRDGLVGLPGWPEQFVRVEAHVETSFGESVWARGALPELGSWGTTGSGLPLYTDGGSYPEWTSGVAELPVGLTTEWKLVAGRDARSVRWEGGGNRSALIMPEPLVDADEQVIAGRWR